MPLSCLQARALLSQIQSDLHAIPSIERAHNHVPLNELQKQKSSFKDLLKNIESLQDSLELYVFRIKTKEGREIVLDLQKEWKASSDFYQSHNLGELDPTQRPPLTKGRLGGVSESDGEASPSEGNLPLPLLRKEGTLPRPSRLRLSRESREHIQHALEKGIENGVEFDRVMFFVPYAKQNENFDKLLEETAAKPVEGLSEEDQYTKPYIDKTAKTKCSLRDSSNGLRSKPYFLLYSSKSIPQETKNKTFEQCDVFFKQKDWNGLTLAEYLLLQRKEVELRKNHRWDAYDDDGAQSNWSWALDSRVPSGYADASWRPGNRRVVCWLGAGNLNPELGARPVVVVKF